LLEVINFLSDCSSNTESGFVSDLLVFQDISKYGFPITLVTCQAGRSFTLLKMISSACTSVSLKVKGQRWRSVSWHAIFTWRRGM